MRGRFTGRRGRSLLAVFATASLLTAFGVVGAAASTGSSTAAAAASSVDHSAVAYTTMSVTATLKDPITRRKIAVVKTDVGRKDAQGLSDADRTYYNASGKKLKAEKLRVKNNRTSSAVADDLVKMVKADEAATAAATSPSASTNLPMTANGYSSGCCSAAGEWWVETSVDEHNVLNMLLDRYHFNMDFCWGGGTPGVHYGYVYSCGNFGTVLWPYRETYFTNINSLNIGNTNPAWQTRAAYLDWPPMQHSVNTEFDDREWASIEHCAYKIPCLQTTHPSLHIWAHANGEYDVESTGGT